MSIFMNDDGVSDDIVVLNSTEIVDKLSDELQILKEIPPNVKMKRKSTFMSDGGVSNDLVVVNCTGTVDKQSDELEILPNSKIKRQGKKRKSTLLDDGGVFNDFMVVHTKIVDKQNDELQILREIPANVKTKRQGKKRQNRSERASQRYCDLPSSSSTGLTPPPRLMQCGNRDLLKGDKKGYKMVDEGSPCNRRWEDMDHEILIHIFKRYPWHMWFRRGGYFICKSWLLAFLDYLFPPGQVLDLRFLDGPELSLYTKSISLSLLNRFYQYLILNLDRRPPDSYTGIVLSEYVLRSKAYEHIARRLPLLKSFVSPKKMIPLSNIPGFTIVNNSERYNYIAWWMCPLMQNLESVCCHTSMLPTFTQYCKSVRSLTLVGGISGFCCFISDQLSLVIAEGFPLLEHLSISGFSISVNGLSMILDSCKNLQCLDVRHTVCNRGRFSRVPHEWPWPEEICTKLESVKTLLTCPGRNCTSCKHYY